MIYFCILGQVTNLVKEKKITHFFLTLSSNVHIEKKYIENDMFGIVYFIIKI